VNGIAEVSEMRMSVLVKMYKKKDVVVVGGGTAGVVAALAARRTGAEVLLIEKTHCLGGMMTGGLVVTPNQFRSRTPGHPLVVRGIPLEIFRRVLQAEGTHPGDGEGPVADDHGHMTDPIIVAQILDEMMEEAGIEVLFETVAFDVIREKNAIKGVVIANKSGGQVVLADVVVDATGDADVAAAAGARFMFGRKEDGRIHGGSMLMVVGGVDLKKYMEYLRSDEGISEEEKRWIEDMRRHLFGAGSGPHFPWEKREGVYKSPTVVRTWDDVERDLQEGTLGRGLHKRLPRSYRLERDWMQYILEGKVPPLIEYPERIYPKPYFYWAGIFKHGKMRYNYILSGVYEYWFNPVDVEESSRAVIFMRRLNKIYLQFLRERVPGFEDAYIVMEAPTIGRRESRRIIGEYVLRAEDCLEGRRFPDVVGKLGCSYRIRRPFDVPYRILIPKDVENLLVAGRCVSVEDRVFGHGEFLFRDQGCCMVTGHAAGTAAALAALYKRSPREIDVKLLQKTLLRQGAFWFADDEKDREEELQEG
jgi:hypothetical protein